MLEWQLQVNSRERRVGKGKMEKEDEVRQNSGRYVYGSNPLEGVEAAKLVEDKYIDSMSEVQHCLGFSHLSLHAQNTNFVTPNVRLRTNTQHPSYTVFKRIRALH